MKHTLLALYLICISTIGFSQIRPKEQVLKGFIARTGATASVSNTTSSPNFLRFPADRSFVAKGQNAEDKSHYFLAENPALYGIRPGLDLFKTKSSELDAYGLTHVTLQQTYQGVPVYEGILRFHYTKDGTISSINGNFIPNIKLSAIPQLSAAKAEELAISIVENPLDLTVPLKARPATLYLYQKGLVYGQLGAVHLVYEVEVKNDLNVRELVYVDAHTGEIVDQIAGMAQLTRVLSETTQGNVIWTEGNAFPGTLNQWQQSEVESAGHIYYLMKHAFNWTSYDNKDATMRTIHNNPNISCPNANWNGVTANYCDGTASDDVVAHEWGHAYTEYTSGLIYAWQSGALNEAYSDIWGETVDLLNNYMDSGENNALRTACGSSDRWRVGEKATAFGGALRDMWNPNCNGDPGKVSDPLYHCIPSDVGGVHINSGVVNHAYALLVDGGTYNGYTINGIGLTKAAHIFWRVQSVYLTPSSDFKVQANALEAAANDLIGQNLRALSTSSTDPGLSGQIITVADVAEVVKVINAVELRLDPLACGHTSYYQPVGPNCDGATPAKAYFYEDFESGLDGWTLSTSNASVGFTPRKWEVTNTSLMGQNGYSAFGADPQIGDCSTTNEKGVIAMESPVISIPATAGSSLSLAFQHYISMETRYDGGNIKYKIGNGAWTLIPASAFTANPYVSTLYTTAQQNDNPLAGQPAFTAGNVNSSSSGWIESRINLSSLGLLPGQTIQFSWELGTDCGAGWDGWYVDNISVYSCSLPAVHFAAASSQVNEAQATSSSGCLNYVDVPVAVTIDKAPSQSATVTFNTPTGTATQGATADYTVSPASVTLSAGTLTANVIIRVYNDGSLEGNETVTLSYTVNANGGDAYAGSELQTHTLTIVDNELDPANFNGEVYAADFNNSLEGWSIINGGSSTATWQRVPYYSQTRNGVTNYFSLVKTPFLFVNSNAAGTAVMDEIVESPAFNTLGFSDLKLQFTEGFFVRTNNTNIEQGIVQVWDGTTWQTILTETQTTGNSGQLGAPVTRTLTIPAAYTNAAMKIRFQYKAQNDYWWAIDDVKITGTPQIQTALTTATPEKQYLGPLATVYFYDPTSNNLIAKIKNLTNHDYGCTSVVVDRAGVDTTAWLENYKITKKTFRVVPTTNNPNGKYEITLYYKPSELPTFNGTAVKSMGKSSGFIGSGNAGDNSWAEVIATKAFYSDYAFTATFTSGFSGFGLSDAPPVGPLPVVLVSFDGKSTNEGNQLSWKTASEAQNDYFLLERSTKNTAFEAIAQIKGAGTTALPSQYHFLDMKATPGINYYRLTQFDFNKKSTQNRIISVDSRKLRELKIYPNPVHSLLTVELPDAAAEKVQVQIFSSNGQQVIQQKNVHISEGQLKTDVSKLTPGKYQVIVTDDYTTYHLSIIKQ